MDLGNSPTYKGVTTGGLVRSPPPDTGYKPPTLGGLPSGFRSGSTEKSRRNNPDIEAHSGSQEEIRPVDKLSGSSTTPDLSPWSKKASASPSTSLKGAQNISSTASSKTKPETPPKKDFRTNLKSRQISGETRGKDEPEFKNVFGKLKKTQTQSYVAPDELKENIMRGKTGLVKTDGPQKSLIRDEFKESILRKKEGMVAPSASTIISSASSKNSDTSTPEAIAKRKGLGRSDDTMSSSIIEGKKPAPKPEALTKLQSLQEKVQPIALKKHDGAPVPIQRALEKPKAGLSGGFTSSLAGILHIGPSPIEVAPNPPPASQDNDAPTKLAYARAGTGSELQNGPELIHATKGRAKGPKRKPPTAVNRETTTNSAPVQFQIQPKRGVNENKSSALISPSQSEVSPDMSISMALSVNTDDNTSIPKNSQPTTPSKPSTSVGKILGSGPSPTLVQTSIGKPSTKNLPTVTPNPINSQNIPSAQDPILSIKQSSVEQRQDSKVSDKARQRADNGIPANDPEDQGSQPVLPSVKSFAGKWDQLRERSQPSQARSPATLPTREDEEETIADTGLRPEEVIGLGIETPHQATKVSQQEVAPASTKSPNSPPLPGRKPATLSDRTDEVVVVNANIQAKGVAGLGGEPPFEAAPTSRKEVVSPLMKTPKTPPLPGKKPATIDSKSSTPSIPSPAPPKRASSPLKEPSESTKLFTNIFDELPSSKTKVKVDTQAVLDGRLSRDSEKIKTLRKHIFEITDNGKSVPVPPDQEHILFEDSLYLCTHVFGTPTGARTAEVYLWCGDGVSPSTIEDAQLFARKTAKDCGGKLMLLRQGKEPAKFFQALGGIVITRKGSSSRSDSAIYMLCGRQHLGQIAFDEVDFLPQNLCKGFPYIISARGGRLYLWKGGGASADELGCARLIGMDLGLTGEIEEINEGNEPDDFFSSFPNGTSKPIKRPSQAQYWHLKPTCERYRTKLFEVDVEITRPKSNSGFMSWGRRGSAPTNDASGALEAKIKEVTPFSQADLAEDSVFVLDTFFEIFMYVHSPILLLQ